MKKWRSTTIMLAALLTAAATDAQPVQNVDTSERQALMAIFAATKGPKWHSNAGWGSAAGTECEWYGVRCRDGHVTGLELQENGLVGEIPSEAVELKWLTSAWLWRNELTAVPQAWLAKEDAGGFDLRLWNNPIHDRASDSSHRLDRSN
jgi:hypothetical protein